MAIPVTLEVFEGPLDLLLYLIDKNKVDIYDIPIVTITDQYMAYIKAMENPKVFILGHPDDGTFEADYEILAEEAARRHVLIELNEASVKPGSYRKEGRKNACRLLSACRRHQTGVILSSDAHIETEILQHSFAMQMLEELQFPENLIVNSSAETVLERLEERKKYAMTCGRKP